MFEQDLFDRGDLVAKARGALELHLFAGGVHLHFELIDELLALARQEHHGVLHVLVVILLVDVEDARARAALDLVLQTRSGAVLERGITARAQVEVLVEHLDRMAHRVPRAVWPEVLGAVVSLLSHDLDARPGVLGVDAQRGVVLVILELDVVARLVQLDQRVLEDQRLLLVGGDDRLDVAQHMGEFFDERARIAGGLEVVADSVFEVLGLADVDDAALLILHQVAAGLVGDKLEFGLVIEHPRGPLFREKIRIF